MADGTEANGLPWRLLRSTRDALPTARLVLLVGAVGLATGCTANLGGGSLDTETEEGAGGLDASGEDAVALGCSEAEPRAVPKLLRLSNEEYRNIVTDVLGVPVDSELFANWTPVAEVYGFDTMSETRIDARSLDEQMRTVEELGKLALQSPVLSEKCPALPSPGGPPEGITLSWENCGKPFVVELASRAFRRPLRAEELGDYQQLFDTSQTEAAAAAFSHPFYEGLMTVVQAVLLSPNLMLKPELVPGGLDADEASYGAASKLAFFFRSSVPDDELWELAQSGNLDEPEALEAQAARMFEEHQERFVLHFGGQWLDYREKSASDDPLMVSMKNETRDVFTRVLADGLPSWSLLVPGFTIVDEPLAEHYALPFDTSAESPREVATDARGGLLSQGFFLRRTASGSDFRRAIHRGLWVVTRLLCREMPRLDAATAQEISESFDAIDRTLPLAEQMEIHRTASPRCLNCHGEIDPVGLALENYDGQGLWRDVDDNGHAIESDLSLFGQTVDEPAALATAIADSEEYRSCVAEKLLTYALNRGPTKPEVCMASELANPSDGPEPAMGDMAISAVLKSFELVEVTP